VLKKAEIVQGGKRRREANRRVVVLESGTHAGRALRTPECGGAEAAGLPILWFVPPFVRTLSFPSFFLPPLSFPRSFFFFSFSSPLSLIFLFFFGFPHLFCRYLRLASFLFLLRLLPPLTPPFPLPFLFLFPSFYRLFMLFSAAISSFERERLSFGYTFLPSVIPFFLSFIYFCPSIMCSLFLLQLFTCLRDRVTSHAEPSEGGGQRRPGCFGAVV